MGDADGVTQSEMQAERGWVDELGVMRSRAREVEREVEVVRGRSTGRMGGGGMRGSRSGRRGINGI